MKSDDLNQQSCVPCHGGIKPLNAETCKENMQALHSEWQLNTSSDTITRSFKFKNFTKTMFFVNALARSADQQGHHPDVKFGYNYCQVSFTTHEAKGLTNNDFICAKQTDALMV